MFLITHYINKLYYVFTVSNSLRKTLNNQIKEELDKCILLCSNCHREVHAGSLNINEIQMGGNDPPQRPSIGQD